MLDNTIVHSLLHLPYQNSHANMMPGFAVDTCQMNIEVLDPSITHSAIINNMYFPSWGSTLLPVPLGTALETFNKLYQITETIYHYFYATSLTQWIPLSINSLADVMANIYRWHFNRYLKIVVFFPGVQWTLSHHCVRQMPDTEPSIEPMITQFTDAYMCYSS